MLGLHISFYLAAVLCLIAVVASLVREKLPVAESRASDVVDGGMEDTLEIAEATRR